MDKPNSSQQKTARTILITSGIVYGLSLCLWVVLIGLLLLSYTFADVPFVYTTLIAYPLVLIGIFLLSLLLYTRERFQLSLLLLLIPLLCGALAFGSYLLLWLSP